MADATSDNKGSSGFNLPPPSDSTAPASTSSTTPSTTTDSGSGSMQFGTPDEGVASRDLLIGGAVLLVLMVAFFVAKNAYATMLVGRKVQPRSANASGWWLWLFLSLLSVGVVMAAVSRSTLMTPFIVGPLSLGALVALVLTLVSGRR